MTTPETIGGGTFKLIVVDAEPDVLPKLEAALSSQIHAADVRRLGPAALIIFCEATPSDIRDWLTPSLNGATVLVTEFERWSSHGDAVDRQWLLRRGH